MSDVVRVSNDDARGAIRQHPVLWVISVVYDGESTLGDSPPMWAVPQLAVSCWIPNEQVDVLIFICVLVYALMFTLVCE
jgi:hypothetical protein